MRLFKVVCLRPDFLSHNRAGWRIDSTKLQSFKNGNRKSLSKNGIYIYALENNAGSTPVYVGKTNKGTFESRALDEKHLLDTFAAGLVEMELTQGRPLIFLVWAPGRRGPEPTSNIKEIEKYLTAVAWEKNAKLFNKKNKPRPRWYIAGVIGPRRGAPTREQSDLKKTLGLL